MLKFKFKNGKLYSCFLALLSIGLIAGFNAGYHEAIGAYPNIVPFFIKSESVMPPQEKLSGQTFDSIGDFIADDITDKEPYEEGMNCVDYALVTARNAQWKGISSEIIRLDFESGFSHAMLLFSTVDRGFIFLDPQTDKVFDVFKVGQLYNGRVITGVYVLGYEWLPLSDFLGGE